MNKIILLFLVLFGCEFRPPNYNFEFDDESTRCFYPVTEVHYYNDEHSRITECIYDNKKRISQENIFSENSLELSQMIIYNYFSTFYEKVIFDYENGSKNNLYVTDKQYISLVQ